MKLKKLSKKELKNINGGGGFWDGLKWIVSETLDDLEGSWSSLVQGANEAPLKRRK